MLIRGGAIEGHKDNNASLWLSLSQYRLPLSAAAFTLLKIQTIQSWHTGSFYCSVNKIVINFLCLVKGPGPECLLDSKGKKTEKYIELLLLFYVIVYWQYFQTFRHPSFIKFHVCLTGNQTFLFSVKVVLITSSSGFLNVLRYAQPAFHTFLCLFTVNKQNMGFKFAGCNACRNVFFYIC